MLVDAAMKNRANAEHLVAALLQRFTIVYGTGGIGNADGLAAVEQNVEVDAAEFGDDKDNNDSMYGDDDDDSVHLSDDDDDDDSTYARYGPRPLTRRCAVLDDSLMQRLDEAEADGAAAPSVNTNTNSNRLKCLL